MYLIPRYIWPNIRRTLGLYCHRNQYSKNSQNHARLRQGSKCCAGQLTLCLQESTAILFVILLIFTRGHLYIVFSHNFHNNTVIKGVAGAAMCSIMQKTGIAASGFRIFINKTRLNASLFGRRRQTVIIVPIDI